MTRLIVAAVFAFASLSAASATALAQGSSGQILYGADGAGGKPGDLVALDPGTGNVAKVIAHTGFAVTGLAVDPASKILYGVTANNDANLPGYLIKINPSNGAVTPVGDLTPPLTTTGGAADITFTPDGVLYGWTTVSDDLVTIDKTTGLSTVVGNAGTSTSGDGLASNAAGTLYFTGKRDNGALSTVDRNTGALTTVATLKGVQADPIAALAFNAAGTLFGAHLGSGGVRPASLITIDLSSGVLNDFLGRAPLGLDAIAFAPKPTRTLKLRVKRKSRDRVVLKGQIVAPNDVGACIAGEFVKLRVKRGKGKGAKLRKSAVDTSGHFRRSAPGGQGKFTYVAKVAETPACGGATKAVKGR